MAAVSFENISSFSIASLLPSLYMPLTKKHLGRPDFGRFLSGICFGVSSGGLGTVEKNPAIFCLKIEGLEMEYVLCLYC